MKAVFRRRGKSCFRSGMTSSGQEEEPPQPTTSRRDGRQLARFMHCVPPPDKGTAHGNYAGALEWLRKHRHDVSTALQIVRKFPHAIHDETLDCLWDFLLPFFDGPQVRQPGVPYDPRRPLTTGRAGCKRVFLCCPRPDQCQSVDLTRLDILINTLLPFCYLRTSSTLYSPRFSYPGDAAFGAMEADVLLFVINKVTLRDQDCLALLTAADAAHIPIVMVREEGYTLPVPLPDAVLRLSQPAQAAQESRLAAGAYLRPQLHPGSPLSKTSSDTATLRQRPRALPHSECKKPYRRPLADVITECFNQSLVYTLELHETCTARLFERLAATMGAGVFPADNSMQHQTNSLKAFGTDLGRTGGEPNGHATKIKPDKKDKSKSRKSRDSESKDSSTTAGRFTRGILRRRSKAKILPPLSKSKSADTDSVLSHDASRQRKSRSQYNRDLGLVDDYAGPYAGMGTTFLLFRNPCRGGEVEHWNPGERDRDSSLTSFSDDSDLSLTIDVFPGEHDVRSHSSSPEL